MPACPCCGDSRIRVKQGRAMTVAPHTFEFEQGFVRSRHAFTCGIIIGLGIFSLVGGWFVPAFVTLSFALLYGLWIRRLSRATFAARLHTCRMCHSTWLVEGNDPWPSSETVNESLVTVHRWGRLGGLG
jgi:hypothetical protein